jgi:hypothetical protein
MPAFRQNDRDSHSRRLCCPSWSRLECEPLLGWFLLRRELLLLLVGSGAVMALTKISLNNQTGRQFPFAWIATVGVPSPFSSSDSVIGMRIVFHVAASDRLCVDFPASCITRHINRSDSKISVGSLL